MCGEFLWDQNNYERIVAAKLPFWLWIPIKSTNSLPRVTANHQLHASQIKYAYWSVCYSNYKDFFSFSYFLHAKPIIIFFSFIMNEWIQYLHIFGYRFPPHRYWSLLWGWCMLSNKAHFSFSHWASYLTRLSGDKRLMDRLTISFCYKITSL